MNNRLERACYEIVLNLGSIPREQLDQVFQEAEGSKLGFSELLLQKGILKEGELLEAYAKSLGAPILNLKTLEIDKALLQKVPIKFAWYYKFFPVKLEGRRLTIAVSRLMDVNTLDEVRLGLGLDVGIAFTSSRDIEDMLKHHYGLGADTVDRMLAQSGSTTVERAGVRVEEPEDIEKLADTPSIVQLVNQIILDGCRRRASDIHIEPFRDKVRLRYRIDGILHEARVPDELKQFLAAIQSRIKIMANLNIMEKRLPQDGKARVRTQDQTLDLRVSAIPTPFGESLVIRILPSKMIYSLEELGFEPGNLETFRSLIERPYGIIFVTGPTGSGKSTTLYAGLRILNSAKRKIVTIEDPIEYELDGITQTQVMPDIGLTFSRGLRSMLRHDPDVMMIGEVRDGETADIAIRVALTGHLILSTLHTNDAASGITRLLDIGIESYLISSSVIAFMAQRLVRVICKHCRTEDRDVTAEMKKMIAAELGPGQDKELTIFTGKGCDECFGTGYAGRIAIHEILRVNEDIRHLILSRSPASEIKRKAKALGMKTLRQDGWAKVVRGITTPQEILQVTEAEEEGAPPFTDLTSVASTHDAQGTIVMFENRRKYERIRVKLPFEFRPAEKLEDRQASEGPVEFEKGETEDLSAGGLCFVATEPLEKGTVLDLRFGLADSEKQIQCLGRVVRVSKLPASPGEEGVRGYRIAALFLAISSEDRAKIEHLCNAGKKQT